MTAYDFELSDAKFEFDNFDTLRPPSAKTGPPNNKFSTELNFDP